MQSTVGERGKQPRGGAKARQFNRKETRIYLQPSSESRYGRMNSPTEDVGTKQDKKKRRQDVTKNVVGGKNVGLVAAKSYKSSRPAAGGTG